MKAFVWILAQAIFIALALGLVSLPNAGAAPAPAMLEAGSALEMAAANRTRAASDKTAAAATGETVSSESQTPAPLALQTSSNKREIGWLMLTASGVFLLLCWLKGQDMERFR